MAMGFSQNLASIRKSANLSQDKLAEQLHITRQAVSKWESGASTPDVETVIRLCEILNVTPDQLLLECHEKKSDPMPDKKEYGNREILLATFFPVVMFLAGMVLLCLNFFSGVFFEPQITIFALVLMGASLIIYFIVLFLMKKRGMVWSH